MSGAICRRIKGGRLALAAAPARLLTLAISDVAGDRPEDIGSGPTVADPTTVADAKAVLDAARYRRFGGGLVGDAESAGFDYRILARPADASPRPRTRRQGSATGQSCSASVTARRASSVAPMPSSP